MAGPVDPRLLKRARATRTYLVAGFAVGLITAILVICQGWLLSRLVVGIFTSHRPANLNLVVILVIVLVIRAGLSWLNQVLARRSAAEVKSQLRADVVAARLQQVGTPQSTSDHITLLTQGLDALDGYFAKYLPQLALACTVPFLVGAAVLWADWTSAVIIMVTLPLIPVFMALIGWTTQARMQRRWRIQQRLARHFSDLIQGLPTLQVFGRARAQRAGLIRTEERNRAETMSTLRVAFLSAFALELIATLSVALIAVAIGLRVVHGHLDFQTGLFVLIIAPEAYLPIRQVGVHYHDSADGVAAVDQAFSLIDQAKKHSGTRQPGDLSSAKITFTNVGHRFPGSTVAALQGFNATIAPGELVVLSGPSGGGKSTALHALMGFIQPSTGTITIGTQNLADLDIEAWRRQLAWVGQQPSMITGTVADNVRLGHEQADDAAVRNALDRAGAQSITLEHMVGDDAEGLSAGERRRVALARALLRIDHGAKVLILDEPTAGLDADAELMVINGVRQTGVTAVVVSHRSTVIEAADHIVTIHPVQDQAVDHVEASR